MDNYIRATRNKLGVSAQLLADRLHTSKGQVYQLEKGERRLTTDWARRIASALHCSIEEILFGTQPLVYVIGRGVEGKVLPLDGLSLVSVNGGGIEIALGASQVRVANIRQVQALAGAPANVVVYEITDSKSMPNYWRGDEIHYHYIPERDLEKLLNKRCLAKVFGQDASPCILRRGAPGKYSLEYFNADRQEDVAIEWATRIEGNRHAS